MMRDTMNKTLEHFVSTGINLPDLVTDGNIHRFSSSNKNKKNSWYISFQHYDDNGNDYYITTVGDWSTGEKETYCSKENWTQKEKVLHTQQVAVIVKKHDEERELKHTEAAVLAELYWDNALDNPRSEYLKRKQITGLHKCKTTFCDYGVSVFVPCRDIKGKLWGLQEIYPDGLKKFLYGQKIKGTFFKFGDISGETPIYICEGFATGASIFEATGVPVLCAFNAGNILQVCQDVRAKYPNNEIVIAGDNDLWTTKPDGRNYNPGREAAVEAAEKVGAKAIFPMFSNDSTHPTDFNDLFLLEGKEAIRKQLVVSTKEMDPSIIPEAFRHYILDGVKGIHVPIEYIAIPCISAFSSLMQNIWAKPSKKDPFCVPSYCWSMGVGDKGTRKSSAFKYGTNFIVTAQNQLDAEYNRKRELYEGETIWLTGKVKALEAKLKKAEDREGARTIMEEIKCAKRDLHDARATRKTLIFVDTTSASMVEILKESQNVIGRFDEMSYLFNMFNQEHYKMLRALFLMGWNGDEYFTKKLKGETEPCIIDHFSITLMGMVQPPAFRKSFADQKGIVDDGLLERFQLCYYPDRMEPKRFEHHEYNRESKAVVQSIFNEVFTIDRKELGAKLDPSGKFHYIEFSDDASELWKDYAHEQEKLAKKESNNYMVGWYAKSIRTIASLANVFFVIEKLAYKMPGREVQKEHVEMAYKWAKHLEDHARKIYSLI